MKKIFMPALLAAALLSGSCSDWTETESLDFSKPTAEQQNTPEYRSYLEAVRNYKQGEHKITMITIEGTSEAPDRQNQHLTAMPDSVDYICVANAVGLHPTVAGEISKVYTTKGTRTLCVVDYMTIEDAWKQLIAEKEEAGIPDTSTPDDFAAYCREQTELQLSCCDAYGFAGVEVSYTGNTQSEIGTRGQKTFLDCVNAWRANHADKLVFVRGYIQNFDYEDATTVALLEECDYVVVLCGSSASYSQMTMEIRRKTLGAMKDKVPTDRFVLEVAIPSIADPTQVGATAPVAAWWAIDIDASKPEVEQKPDAFTKAGLAVANAQDDYFNGTMIYNNVRQAIAIMNPAPKN